MSEPKSFAEQQRPIGFVLTAGVHRLETGGVVEYIHAQKPTNAGESPPCRAVYLAPEPDAEKLRARIRVLDANMKRCADWLAQDSGANGADVLQWLETGDGDPWPDTTREKKLRADLEAQTAVATRLATEHAAMSATLAGAVKSASDAIEAKRTEEARITALDSVHAGTVAALGNVERELAAESAKVGQQATEIDRLRDSLVKSHDNMMALVGSQHESLNRALGYERAALDWDNAIELVAARTRHVGPITGEFDRWRKWRPFIEAYSQWRFDGTFAGTVPPTSGTRWRAMNAAWLGDCNLPAEPNPPPHRCHTCRHGGNGSNGFGCTRVCPPVERPAWEAIEPAVPAPGPRQAPRDGSQGGGEGSARPGATSSPRRVFVNLSGEVTHKGPNRVSIDPVVDFTVTCGTEPRLDRLTITGPGNFAGVWKRIVEPNTKLDNCQLPAVGQWRWHRSTARDIAPTCWMTTDADNVVSMEVTEPSGAHRFYSFVVIIDDDRECASGERRTKEGAKRAAEREARFAWRIRNA